MGSLVAGRFELKRMIGRGAFGTVHQGIDLDSSEPVAVKVEPSTSKRPLLLYEARVCKSLAGKPGFPRLRYCGFEPRRSVLVMDLLGPSLTRLRALCGGRLSFKTVLMLGIQLMNRLEDLHSEGYIHRDISEANVLLGRGEDDQIVHLIDYGLCKRFRDAVTQKHIGYRQKSVLKGTMVFASLNALRGGELSRRDDLEAVGYLLLFLLRGSLPWQTLPKTYTKRAAYEELVRARGSESLEDMCSDLPQGGQELTEYLTYCRGLGFEEDPDYDRLRTLFLDAMAREGYEHDLVYDWQGLDAAAADAPAGARL